MAESGERKKLTVPDLIERKRAGERVVMASITDYMMAVWAERAGIDICAVGDSLGMTAYGHPNTLPVTLDQMIEHTRAVRRGAPNTLIITAMPYGSYTSQETGVENAVRLMKESGCDVVKMQGGEEKAHIIEAIAESGVPVMSHVGMCPHFVHGYGGFKVQGRKAEDALQIIGDACAIEQAGACGFEIEAVPAPVGKLVNDAVDIFTFSIGAGPAACGQLLLGADLLGAFDQFKPKFTKRYANLAKVAVEGFEQYAKEVRDGVFPDGEHGYTMKDEELKKLREMLAEAREIFGHPDRD